MSQVITAEGACAAARKAYDEDRLLAQCTTVAPHLMFYGYEVYCAGTMMVCAIGSCLNRESLDTIEKDRLSLTTMSSGRERLSYIFECADGDLDKLEELQSAHDSWLLAKMKGHAQGPGKSRFLSVIGR